MILVENSSSPSSSSSSSSSSPTAGTIQHQQQQPNHQQQHNLSTPAAIISSSRNHRHHNPDLEDLVDQFLVNGGATNTASAIFGETANSHHIRSWLKQEEPEEEEEEEEEEVFVTNQDLYHRFHRHLYHPGRDPTLSDAGGRRSRTKEEELEDHDDHGDRDRNELVDFIDFDLIPDPNDSGVELAEDLKFLDQLDLFFEQNQPTNGGAGAGAGGDSVSGTARSSISSAATTSAGTVSGTDGANRFESSEFILDDDQEDFDDEDEFGTAGLLPPLSPSPSSSSSTCDDFGRIRHHRAGSGRCCIWPAPMSGYGADSNNSSAASSPIAAGDRQDQQKQIPPLQTTAASGVGVILPKQHPLTTAGRFHPYRISGSVSTVVVGAGVRPHLPLLQHQPQQQHLLHQQQHHQHPQLLLKRQDSSLGSTGTGSSSSSTPSTPSSIVGLAAAKTPSSSSSVSTPATASTVLPSFEEIYSPSSSASRPSTQPHHGHHRISTGSFITGDQQQRQQYPAAITGSSSVGTQEFFKFEDYISESESDLDQQHRHSIGQEFFNQPATLSPGSSSTTSTSYRQQQQLLHTDLQVKEEILDTMDTSDYFLPVVATPGESSLCLTTDRSATAGDDNNGSGNNEQTIEQHKPHDVLAEATRIIQQPIHHASPPPPSTSAAAAVPYQPQSFANIETTAATTPTTVVSLNIEQQPQSSPSSSIMMMLGTTATGDPLSTASLVVASSMQQQQQYQPPPEVKPSQETYHHMASTSLTPPASHHHHRVGRSLPSSHRGHRTKTATLQTCAVCGDVAACQHYGVLTCEGCKGFFKRTVQKGSKYTCLGNKDCTVDKRRRNRCQFCRFQKCLAVGMVKEVVRTDSLKGRRGRLPSKPKQPQQRLGGSDTANTTMIGQAGTAVSGHHHVGHHQHNLPIAHAGHHQPHHLASPPMSTIAALIKAHEETSADKANLDFSQFNENVGQFVGTGTESAVDHQVLSLLSASLDHLMMFVERIPGFVDLPDLDKKILFQNSCLELFALRMAYGMTPGTNFIVLCNNIVLHRNQFLMALADWLPMIDELSRQLHAMALDLNAFVCLCALTVITARDGQVQDPNQIEQIENKIISSLCDHTAYNNEAQRKPNYFSRILTKISELRTIGEFGHRIITGKIRLLMAQNTDDTDDPARLDIAELEQKLAPSSAIMASTESITDNLANIVTTTVSSTCPTSTSAAMIGTTTGTSSSSSTTIMTINEESLSSATMASTNTTICDNLSQLNFAPMAFLKEWTNDDQDDDDDDDDDEDIGRHPIMEDDEDPLVQ